MSLFNFGAKSRNSRSKSRRFRARYFQQRVRNARSYHRQPRISPRAQTKISFRKRHLRYAFIFLAVTAILIVCCYYLFFAETFLVKEVVVLQNSQISEKDLESWVLETKNKRVFFFIPKNHILLLDQNSLLKIFSEHTSYISEIKNLKKIYPNKIEVTVEERSPVAVWQSAGNYFFIDKQGFAYEQIPAGYATSSSSYLKIIDTTNTPVVAGDDLNIDKILEFYIFVSENWGKIISSKPQEIQLGGRFGQDIRFVSVDGWVVYFDLNHDPKIQLRNLRLIIDQEVPVDRRTQLAYIDLRLSDKAYFCYKGEPCASIVVTQPIAD